MGHDDVAPAGFPRPDFVLRFGFPLLILSRLHLFALLLRVGGGWGGGGGREKTRLLVA